MDKCAETDNGGSRGQLKDKHDAEQYHLSLSRTAGWFFSFKRKEQKKYSKAGKIMFHNLIVFNTEFVL